MSEAGVTQGSPVKSQDEIRRGSGVSLLLAPDSLILMCPVVMDI